MLKDILGNTDFFRIVLQIDSCAVVNAAKAPVPGARRTEPGRAGKWNSSPYGENAFI